MLGCYLGGVLFMFIGLTRSSAEAMLFCEIIALVLALTALSLLIIDFIEILAGRFKDGLGLVMK